MSEPYTLYLGDCLEVMPRLPDSSVDAVVTDPPYGLSFMGKNWDHGVPGEQFWREVLRVAKPGAHLLAFGGTRTYHRLACAIEDAGWEVRDCLMWVYGSGFPKSLDVSKAIDRRGGQVVEFAEFRDAVKAAMQRNGISRQQLQDALGNQMLCRYLTAGSQPVVPALPDYRIIRDTVGLGNEFDELFNDEAEREVVGTSINGIAGGTGKHAGQSDAYGYGAEFNITAPATDAARQWEGWGTALKPAIEPIILARKPFQGTVAENVLRYGTGGINVDGCRVGTGGGRWRSGEAHDKAYPGGMSNYDEPAAEVPNLGRWPANLIHDGSDEVVGLLDEAARFFQTCPDTDPEDAQARLVYCAKTSKRDRDEGCEGIEERTAGECTDRTEGSDGLNSPRAGAGRTSGSRNHHPTVKPTDLMRYLCRLVCPPGGTVLDPFMGSGSTGKACGLEGFQFVGIEQSPEYMPIASARVAFGYGTPAPAPEPGPATPEPAQEGQLSLFG